MKKKIKWGILGARPHRPQICPIGKMQRSMRKSPQSDQGQSSGRRNLRKNTASAVPTAVMPTWLLTPM
jgi:hypothetical protein